MRALVCRDGNLTLDRTYPMPEPQAGEAWKIFMSCLTM